MKITIVRGANNIFWARKSMTDFVQEAIDVSLLQFKVPDPYREGSYTIGAPVVYSQFIPSDVASQQGATLTQVTPSVLVRVKEGTADLIARKYHMSFTLILSVWDDAPDYGGSQDLDTLMDTLMQALMRAKNVGKRFRLDGDLDFEFEENDDRKSDFTGTIKGKMYAGITPDETDSWL
jgi:hypothetical protein